MRIYAKRLAVRSEDVNREVYTYGSERVNRDPVWGENFTAGDLPAGEYEIVVLKGERKHRLSWNSHGPRVSDVFRGYSDLGVSRSIFVTELVVNAVIHGD